MSRIPTSLPDKAVAVSLQILENARNELYINMRYLSLALSALQPVINTELEGFAADGRIMAVHPLMLADLFEENPLRVNRMYLHMVLHCLFRHLWNRKGRDRRLWNVSCDIAVESVADSLRVRSVRMGVTKFRQDTYQMLKEKIPVLTAEGICHTIAGMLEAGTMTQAGLCALERAFCVDSHVLWPDGEETDPPADLPLPESSQPLRGIWDEIAAKTQTHLESFGRDAGSGQDELLRTVQIENREKYDYKGFLRKFAVWRERMSPDPDQFDYIYYTYGLSHYGNMPLIEPQEAREDKRIEDFAIVLDVSLSTSGSLVRNFLQQTYTVLTERDSFFRHVNIRIIQCDDHIRDDVKVTCREEMEAYMAHFTLQGGGGTDFRPAFAYVRELAETGAFTDLRGMIYFTDGRGIYPVKPPPWACAFVFMEEDFTDVSVPPWAYKLIIEKEQLEEKQPLRTDLQFVRFN